MQHLKILLTVLSIVNIVIVNMNLLDEVPEKQPKVSTENWTSCEEFLNNTTFDPRTVVDIDWKIFYFWHFESSDSFIVRFSIPYPMLVDRFRIELDDLYPPVNWNDSVLFMETSIDFSAVYIATSTPGRFRMISNLAFHYRDLPNDEFALKLVYPGYLGILNCKHRFCYALAPVDKMPTEKNIDKEAERLGFKGDYNCSYLLEEQPSLQLSIFEDDDTDRDPEELYNDDD